MLIAVRKGVTQIATITYLADGTKVKVQAADGSTLLYRGKFVYRVALNGLLTIESVEHDHGRFLPGNSANEFIDTWYVRDYLGSRIDNADLPTLAQNRFRFNGKEKLICSSRPMNNSRPMPCVWRDQIFCTNIQISILSPPQESTARHL